MTYCLGRIQSKFDIRDYNLLDFLPKGIKKFSLRRSKKWDFPATPLNQNNTNHCVGMSMAGFGINLPIYTPFGEEDGHRFYYLCKELEGEPENESGATLRSAAKVLKNLGVINSYAFAHSIASIKWWLLNKGPLIAGTAWTEDMFIPDNMFRVSPTGETIGGHAYLLNEWTIDGYIGFQNSWGEWGDKGKAYISSSDFTKLFLAGGEVVTAVEIGAEQTDLSCCALKNKTKRET